MQERKGRQMVIFDHLKVWTDASVPASAMPTAHMQGMHDWRSHRLWNDTYVRDPYGCGQMQHAGVCLMRRLAPLATGACINGRRLRLRPRA